MQSRVSAPPKSPYRAATPVIAGLVGGAFAMTAAFAMTTATRPDRPSAGAGAKAAVLIAEQSHAVPNPVTPEMQAVAFNAPVTGFAVNSPFGMRRMPWEEGGRLHEGVDIAAPAGTPVMVTLDGVVTRTGLSGSYGRFVEVEHENGLVSFYAHLGRAAKGIKAGVPVAAGQVVAYVGGTGRSTGSHLHFEIRLDGKPLNPVLFMGKTFASWEHLPIKDAARFSRRVRVAVVSRWPASVKPGITKVSSVRTAANLQVQPAADGRVRAVIQAGGGAPNTAYVQMVARDPAKAAEARARLKTLEAKPAEAGAKPAAAPAGGTAIPLERVKVQPLVIPSVG